MEDSRSHHARPLLGTFYGLSSHISIQSDDTYSTYLCESGSALTCFFSRDDGENLLICAKPTTKTVTVSDHCSPFVAPTGSLRQRAQSVVCKRL